MCDDSDDDDISFHLLLRPPPEPLPNDVPPNRQDSSSSSSSTSSSRSTSSSSSSEKVQATTSREPPSKRQRKGKGKGNRQANRPEKNDDKDEVQSRFDSIKLCSTAALGWAQRICSFAYQNGGGCAYDHVDVFTEFSGSTCAESAVESVINHMDPKPTLNFCYSADIKPGCRKVAMLTRHDLGFLKQQKNLITMPTVCKNTNAGLVTLMMQIVNELRSNIVLFR